MPHSYNGGIASYAIWLPELTKFIEFYQSGYSIADIKQMSDEKNIFQMPTKARARRCSRNLAVRVKALPESVLNVFSQLDTTNQRIVSLLSVMLTSRILDEFIYEVYRPKVQMREDTLQGYEVEAFINQKRIESPAIAKWSLNTYKRIKGALKTYLRDGGLMEIDPQNKQQDKLLFPLLDSQLVLAMKTAKLDYELAALGGM
ncbi:MAG: DUF1819 family protein [Staphylococcus equorum]|nr:DUF1819 family protein [Lactobacillus kefiranofaciens]MDN5638567.1 DUF1819 family protein [Staphylococcus equorum]